MRGEDDWYVVDGHDPVKVEALKADLAAGRVGVVTVPLSVRAPVGRPYLPTEPIPEGMDPKDIQDMQIAAEHAYAFASTWVAHPATREVVQERSSAFIIAAGPIVTNFVPDEQQIARFAWLLAEIGGDDDYLAWVVPKRFEQALTRCIEQLRAYVRRTAELIAERGAPVRPEWSGDIAVVAEMLLLDQFTKVAIPWGAPKRELAEFFSVAGVAAMTLELDGHRARLQAPDDAEEAVMRIRKRLVGRKLGVTPMARVYNGGRERAQAVTDDSALHIEVMRRFRQEMPDTPLSKLLKPTGPARRCYAKHHEEVFGTKLRQMRSKSQLYRDAGTLDAAENIQRREP